MHTLPDLPALPVPTCPAARPRSWRLGAALVATALLGLGPTLAARAQTLIERSAETRLQVDFHVPDAALAAFLPSGWAPQIATAGAARGANVRLIFVDRMAIGDAQGQPRSPGSTRLAYLAVPVRHSGTDEQGQMIIAGIASEAAAAPGPFGSYALAERSEMRRETHVEDDGRVGTTEHWLFEAAGGEHLQIDARFERAPALRRTSSTRFYAPGNPAISQIYKVDAGLDIMRNATVAVRDRVSEFSYKASGGRFTALFDGTEQVLSIDAFPWYDLTVLAP